MSNSDFKVAYAYKYVQIFDGRFDNQFDRQKKMDFKRYLLLLNHLAIDRANNELSLSPLSWTEAKSPHSSRE